MDFEGSCTKKKKNRIEFSFASVHYTDFVFHISLPESNDVGEA
jgi:hypothetical protein